MTNQTRLYVERALADNGVVELRHLPSKRTGWFNNADDLLVEARKLASDGNLFISLNRPAPMIASNAMTGRAVGNDDIQFITRLFFDLDPVRPKGCPSTAEELDHAKWLSREVFKMQRAMGWPDPLEAVSGNGTHLLYRCHLPNTEEIRQQMKAIYSGMYTDYNQELISFDRAVRNPGRICTLYGSYKRKGISTPDRPHRQSQITAWPRDWKQVPRKNFDALAEFYAIRDKPVAATYKPVDESRRVSGDGDYRTLDAVAWFNAHGLYEHHVDGIIHAVECPWEKDHSETNPDDTIIYANTDGGWPGFHCKHSHCEGRNIRDVIEHFGDADQFCSKNFKHTADEEPNF